MMPITNKTPLNTNWPPDSAKRLEQVEPEDLGDIKDGAYIAGALPYIDASVERKLKALDNKMISELAGGKLTESMALMFCIERICLLKLMKSFKQQVRRAVNKGEDLHKSLDL